MNLSESESKARLRTLVRSKVESVSAALRAVATDRINARVRELPDWREAESRLLYMPMPDELDVRPLAEDSLRAGKLVALPRFEPGHQKYGACRILDLAADLAVGRYGVLEPGIHCPVVPLNRLDFVLVPGVAFTVSGRRLGRGKGHYDRLLASVTGTKCGVALDQQIVESIPVEAHDVQLDWIVTPTRSVRVSERASRF